MAIREDELAATCMGINAARVKLSAFALGCGLAGLAGCLYATTLTSTAGPDAFDFNRSIIMLCCIILGGLGQPPRHAAGRGAADRLRQRRWRRSGRLHSRPLNINPVGQSAADVQQLEADDLWPGADPDDAIPARGIAAFARQSQPS